MYVTATVCVMLIISSPKSSIAFLKAPTANWAACLRKRALVCPVEGGLALSSLSRSRHSILSRSRISPPTVVLLSWSCYRYQQLKRVFQISQIISSTETPKSNFLEMRTFTALWCPQETIIHTLIPHHF